MKKRLLLLGFLVALCSPTAITEAQVSFGVTIGTPPPPPRAYVVPRRPGPAYEWVEGHWDLENGHYVWYNGYWTHPPYAGAYWEAPYYSHGRYYRGHWDGDHGRIEHDHRTEGHHNSERHGER